MIEVFLNCTLSGWVVIAGLVLIKEADDSGRGGQWWRIPATIVLVASIITRVWR